MQAEIICKNCGHAFHGNYCNECGEKVYTDHDKTFAHFMEEGFHFLTHFDSKFLRTWWLVMTRPGLVSSNIAAGARKAYYKPFSLFIVGVILYLLFPIFQGLNMPMKSHLHEPYAPIAKAMIDKKMEAKNLTLDQLAQKFDQKSPKFAKILLLIIIPLAGLVLQLLFLKKPRFYFDHVTLAAELNTFFLYFIFFLLPIVFVLVYLIGKLFNSSIILGDLVSMPIYGIMFGIYSYTAFRRFYHEKKAWAILKSVIFLLAHVLIVYFIYKFILLSVVLLFI